MWSKFVVSPRSCNGKFVFWIEINHLSSKQLHPSVVYGCTQFRLLQPRNLKICFNVMFLVEIQLDLFYFLRSYLASKWSNLSLSSFRVFPRSLNLISSFQENIMYKLEDLIQWFGLDRVVWMHGIYINGLDLDLSQGRPN